jgi:hypothetical protein
MNGHEMLNLESNDTIYKSMLKFIKDSRRCISYISLAEYVVLVLIFRIKKTQTNKIIYFALLINLVIGLIYNIKRIYRNYIYKEYTYIYIVRDSSVV